MSLANKTFFSSLILLSLSFAQRSLGIISTLILARILTPDDFGIVAIVSLIVFLFDSLSTSGSTQYIIQKAEVSDDDLNSAWTIDIILKFSFFIICLILTPFIADFFHQKELENALYAIAIILPILGLGNPGVYLLRKNLEFKAIAKLLIISKLISISLVISLALYYKNYWAMIVGTIFSYFIPLIGTYIIHPHRPKICFKKIPEQWNFSQWLFLKSIVGYSKGQIDSFLVAHFFNVASIGGYNLMKNLSSMPATEIVAPATQPLLSAFSKSKNDPDVLNYQLNLSLLIMIILISPFSSFMYYFDSNIVSILLGDKWLEYANILGILSIGLITLPIGSIVEHYSTALGNVKILFISDLISSFVTIFILILFRDSNLEIIALLRVVISVFMQFGLLGYLHIRYSASFLFSLKCIFYYSGLSFILAYLIKTNIAINIDNIFFETTILVLIHFFLYLFIFLFSLTLRKQFKEIDYVYKITIKSYHLIKRKINDYTMAYLNKK